jgi:hypothetical protein
MGVHDVEGVVGQSQGVHVAHDDLGVGDAALLQPRSGDRSSLVVHLDGDHIAHEEGEVRGDGSGTGADVEQSVVGTQVRQQIGRAVGDGPRAMRPQDALCVPVGIGHPQRTRGWVGGGSGSRSSSRTSSTRHSAIRVERRGFSGDPGRDSPFSNFW